MSMRNLAALADVTNKKGTFRLLSKCCVTGGMKNGFDQIGVTMVLCFGSDRINSVR